jgi:hypothetical protein
MWDFVLVSGTMANITRSTSIGIVFVGAQLYRRARFKEKSYVAVFSLDNLLIYCTPMSDSI